MGFAGNHRQLYFGVIEADGVRPHVAQYGRILAADDIVDGLTHGAVMLDDGERINPVNCWILICHQRKCKVYQKDGGTKRPPRYFPVPLLPVDVPTNELIARRVFYKNSLDLEVLRRGGRFYPLVIQARKLVSSMGDFYSWTPIDAIFARVRRVAEQNNGISHVKPTTIAESEWQHERYYLTSRNNKLLLITCYPDEYLPSVCELKMNGPSAPIVMRYTDWQKVIRKGRLWTEEEAGEVFGTDNHRREIVEILHRGFTVSTRVWANCTRTLQVWPNGAPSEVTEVRFALTLWSAPDLEARYHYDILADWQKQPNGGVKTTLGGLSIHHDPGSWDGGYICSRKLIRL